MIADDGGFTDHGAGTMVDEEVGTNVRSRVQVHVVHDSEVYPMPSKSTVEM
jgi:hypothetical protein